MTLSEFLFNLNVHTKTVIPISLTLLFLLFLMLIFSVRKQIFKEIIRQKRQVLLFLGLIIILGFVLRITLPSTQFVIFTDEPEHAYGASVLIHSNSLEVYERSTLMAFFIAISFFLFGTSPFIAIWTTLFFGLATIPFVFFIVKKITNRDSAGLFSSLLIAVHPSLIRWSVTAESNIHSLFFLAIGILTTLLFLNEKTYKTSFKQVLLILISCAFAMFIRIEFIFLLLLIGLVLVHFFKNQKFKDKNYFRKVISIFLLFFLLTIPTLINRVQYQMNYTPLGTSFKGTELEYSIFHPEELRSVLFSNIHQFSYYLFSSLFNPMTITIFALVGFFSKKKEVIRNSTGIFVLFFILFLLFFIEVQGLGEENTPISKSRFFMELQFFLILLAGIGFSNILTLITKSVSKKSIKFQNNIKKITIFMLFSITIMSFVPSLQFTKSYYNNDWSKLETDVINNLLTYIPENCTLVGRWFETYAMYYHSIDIVSTPEFLNSKPNTSRNCFYYIDDMHCKYWGVNTELHQAPCIKLKQAYSLKLKHIFREKYTDKTLELYKIISKK